MQSAVPFCSHIHRFRPGSTVPCLCCTVNTMSRAVLEQALRLSGAHEEEGLLQSIDPPVFVLGFSKTNVKSPPVETGCWTVTVDVSA